MKIKKIGHCCLVIETNGKKIMTDPGSFTSEEHTKERDIDIILISHEHPDHMSVSSLPEVLKNNPKAVVLTNAGAGKVLTEAGIKYEILPDKTPKNFDGVEIEAHDCKHEEIYQDFNQVLNTGFFIDKRLFYPGDSFYNPKKKVEILALPVSGPWTKIKDAIVYAMDIRPNICFPIHDGMLNSFGSAHEIPELVLTSVGNIVFKNLEDKNKEQEF
jgi:L-ascorbate metabolism protein UlaG (beta-lactamase superfamily)